MILCEACGEKRRKWPRHTCVWRDGISVYNVGTDSWVEHKPESLWRRLFPIRFWVAWAVLRGSSVMYRVNVSFVQIGLEHGPYPQIVECNLNQVPNVLNHDH